jgi:gas vesicle protein
MDNKAGIVGLGIGIGVGIGSALMYWFDPSAGKRRRAHVRYEFRRVVKQVQNTRRQLQKTIDRTAGDLAKISRMKVGDVAGALVPARARAMMR